MKRTLLLVTLLTLVVCVAAAAQEYSEWSSPINLGPVVNSPYQEAGVCISRDGLSMYITSLRPGGQGLTDLWVSTRAVVTDPWGAPVNLGPNVNSPFNDNAPFLSNDGHSLYFHSTRPGGSGGMDLWVSRRHNKRDDFGWQPPVNLGPVVNSPADDGNPFVYEDETTGVVSLYFNSKRDDPLGLITIYVSTLQPDESFGPPVRFDGFTLPPGSGGPFITHDGREFYFSAAQSNPLLGSDLWVATRADSSQPWSGPVNLGPVLNTDRNDSNPHVSWDGTELYYSSASSPRGGNTGLDIYVSTRIKLHTE